MPNFPTKFTTGGTSANVLVYVAGNDTTPAYSFTTDTNGCKTVMVAAGVYNCRLDTDAPSVYNPAGKAVNMSGLTIPVT